jgi:hypothetical protein
MQTKYEQLTNDACVRLCHGAPATAAVLRERIKDALRIIALKKSTLILKQENYHKATGISNVWRRWIASK